MSSRADEPGGKSRGGTLGGVFGPNVLLAWLLVGVWAAIVWGLGSDQLSAHRTATFLRPILQWFVPDLTLRQMYEILVVIRKTAHVVEYAILAILTFRALVLGKRPSIATCAALAIAFVLTFAAADETRQGYSKARTGSARDVALDATGGVIAISVLLYLRLRKSRPPTDESTDSSSAG